MSYKAKLDSAASSFLATTNTLYAECDRGISEIERIIVAAPSALGDKTRGYMVPLLYAYWERFFKISFAEFLRALDAAGLSLADCRSPMARYRIRKELHGLTRALGITPFWEIRDKVSTSELTTIFQNLGTWLKGPINLKDPAEWVETDSNVKFPVLERNCKLVGVDVSAIKARMKGKMQLQPGLLELVNMRNEIAHGATFKGVTAEKWNELRDFVGELQTALQLELWETLLDESKCVEAQRPTLQPHQTRTVGDYWDWEAP